jgi:hypothetical protein
MGNDSRGGGAPAVAGADGGARGGSGGSSVNYGRRVQDRRGDGGCGTGGEPSPISSNTAKMILLCLGPFCYPYTWAR